MEAIKTNIAKKIIKKMMEPYFVKEDSSAKQQEIKVNYEDKDKIFKKLEKKTNNYRYFPIIFHKKKFIGGFVDLEKELK